MICNEKKDTFFCILFYTNFVYFFARILLCNKLVFTLYLSVQQATTNRAPLRNNQGYPSFCKRAKHDVCIHYAFFFTATPSRPHGNQQLTVEL